MRVALAVERWPGIDDAREAAVAAGAAWNAYGTAEVGAWAIGDGGPRSADMVGGQRSLVGGAEIVTTSAGLVLSPRGAAARWNPLDLSTALLGLAASPPLGAVIVPVGDEPPAGDASDLWGGALPAVRKALGALTLRALVTSDRPLLGFHGMSSAVRDGRERDHAIAAAAQTQEDRWRAIAAGADVVAARGALLGPRRLSDEAGTGAAGGLAYCLAAVGAALTPAADYLAELSGFGDRARAADVVVGVVASLTPHVLDHGLPATVARLAGQRGVPGVVLAVDIGVGKRDLMAAGLSSVHEGRAGAQGFADVIRRVAHTWTPGR